MTLSASTIQFALDESAVADISTSHTANEATGVSDMAGEAARAAVERCGNQPRYNPHAQPRSIRVQRVTLQTLIDNRILQVQTVVLSRRRRKLEPDITKACPQWRVTEITRRRDFFGYKKH
jgi:hypothetical protein